MSKLKFIITVFVVFFITVCFACQSAKDDDQEIDVAAAIDSVSGNKAAVETQSTTETGHKVIAYYFYSTRRCPSCKKIEAYSREAIENRFVNELKTGQLEWTTINTDKDENEHYVEDYQLYTKSLIIVNMKDSIQTEWKNLDKIWQLLNNKDYFIEYVQFEIDEYLKNN
jgi:glutaredoxin